MTEARTAALAKLASVLPKAFARTRDALAAELRAAGDAEGARLLKARRAPTAPVWVVNRLAAQSPDHVAALAAAADRVRAAQLGRGGVDTLAAETASYRAALERLLQDARAVLSEGAIAPTRQLLSRIETTLGAAAADPAALADLRRGQLERELAARGFDVFAGGVPPMSRVRRDSVQPRATSADAAPDRKADQRRDERRQAREQAAAFERQRHRERLAQAEAALDEARRRAAHAEEEATAARRRVDELSDQLRDARRVLAERTAAVRVARRAVQQAARAFSRVGHAPGQDGSAGD